MSGTALLEGTFVATQVAYLVAFAVMGYFLTRRVNWVDMDLVDRVEPEHYPPILLLYPVLREAEATMRTTFLGLAEIDYPRERYRVIAVPNHDDRATIDSLTRLADEFDFVEVMTVPPTTDESWDVVWEAWDANPKAYWWHLGRGADARHHPDRKRRCDLPPKKTRQLVYAFYNLVAEHGEEGWLLNYIDADSVPPKDHFLAAVAGMQEYDVLQSTNIAGHLLATWPSSWHSFDHMSWDGLIYPHMSANGKHPYWVLGKGLFMRASDVVGVGGFNPWLTIEDPDVGMRLWKAGKRLGVIANPLIEEVPITVRDGITQRKRWIAGFFQSLAAPLRHMGMTGWERFKARLNLVPSLSLISASLSVSS
jgi:cellulose synthase/poly-beta-1,6-N-acetylglucosamine synthase-like glycosyltransferase